MNYASSILGLLPGGRRAPGIGQLVSKMFVTVSPRDPATLLAVGAALFAVTVLAAFLPARRAIRMDPVNALRTE